jgi:hypothetical protein
MVPDGSFSVPFGATLSQIRKKSAFCHRLIASVATSKGGAPDSVGDGPPVHESVGVIWRTGHE